ncbi:transposase [Ruegeria jejuensis]|uniref:transposase n=1 Tax=Ruegeria jejuensis TaxID=3233338 RepID=UPI00355B82B2
MSKRKKRFWSDEEKCEICQQASLAGVSVAQVAWRYAVNANLIFKWLKDPRFAPDVVDVAAEPVFLPVEIGSEVRDSADPMAATIVPSPVSSGRIEIELAGGCQWHLNFPQNGQVRIPQFGGFVCQPVQ